MNPKVISEEIIKPSNTTPIHLRYLNASLFDQVSAPVLMPLIFFYSKQHTPSTSTILKRLKNSLSRTLSVFYPLAGRVQDANYIVCNDEGVPYVQTKVTSTCLSEVVHNADVSLLDKLLTSHGNDQGYDKLLMAIQVNTFACGGVAIGIKISHAISDAFSFAMFAKTWASIANGDSQRLSPSPCFEIWKQFPPYPSKLIDNNTTNISGEPNPDLIESRPVTKWFMFSKAMCIALRSWLCSDYNSQNLPSLTMVLSAFIWSSIKLACKSRSDKNIIPYEVYQAVNVRPKVKTLSKSYYHFGNMVVNAIAKPNQDHDHDKSLCNSYLVAMQKSIDKIIDKSTFIEGMQNGIEDLRFMIEHFERESKGEIVSLGFSSLRSLPMYEADFGWGKPVWVTSATLVYKDLVIMIPGGASSEDTYAYVNLSHDEMAKLQADHLFLSFVSKSATFVTSKL